MIPRAAICFRSAVCMSQVARTHALLCWDRFIAEAVWKQLHAHFYACMILCLRIHVCRFLSCLRWSMLTYRHKSSSFPSLNFPPIWWLFGWGLGCFGRLILILRSSISESWFPEPRYVFALLFACRKSPGRTPCFAEIDSLLRQFGNNCMHIFMRAWFCACVSMYAVFCRA